MKYKHAILVSGSPNQGIIERMEDICDGQIWNNEDSKIAAMEWHCLSCSCVPP
jgi:hypothetical protein